ncbi:MAG TPA: thiolase domain-containing protein [Candidatus Thermoplasmatota archaeon]|nr:thiolase domain-containing protein [Candidatus Thermoplasmatota archaeon]
MPSGKRGLTRPEAHVIGAAHTRFGEQWEKSYRDLMTEAGLAAIKDAGIQGDEIDAVFLGTMSTGKLVGQEHVAPLLLDGAGLADRHLPATRIEAASASGGVAFRQGVQLIRSGSADIVVVGGIEKMTDVSDADAQAIASAGIDQEWEHFFGATDAALHALLAKLHMHQFGTTRDQLAQVAVKNHAHGARNPLAQYRKAIDRDTVLNSPLVAEPLTMFDCAPLSDGAACIVLASDKALGTHRKAAVRVAGSGQASDTLAFHSRSNRTTWSATEHAARRAYQEAGVSAGDIQVAEVHDAYTIGEVLAIEDLGFVKKGQGGPATEEGRTTFGGDLPVVNTSGGLKARGHPAGATGIAQVCEVVWQLRGTAGERQVKDARIGITHNVGGTGATAVVHVLEVE